MKLSATLLMALILLAAAGAHAAFYKWTDDGGVIHFTDSRNKIPKKYKNKARELNPPGKSAPSSGRETAGSAASEPKAPEGKGTEEPSRSAAAPPTPGGHTEQWWRERFSSLKNEQKALENDLSLKQVRLLELRRERRIFTRARDRVALNELEAEVSANEARRAEIAGQLEALEQEAVRSGVPAEWRR